MEVAVYARVSTEDQELQQQITSCRRFCEYKGYEVARVFSEKVSGAKAKRPQYLELVKELRQMQYGGVVVFRLDRLGRNSRELALLIDELENKGIKVLSVNESFDTSTAMGRAMRELIYVFAQLEREQISEATTQRLAAVKLAGKRLGQKPLSEFQVNKVKELAAQGLSCRKIANQMHLSKSAAYNVIHQKGFYQLSDETAKN
jgi:DNA invertase Pin-like site-specific DNA recombinase